MHNAQQSVFTRDDTFFGVCEAIGQDFGFNSNILRVALGVSLLLSPVAVIATYVSLGVIVLAARLIFPVSARSKPAAKAPAAPAQADNDHTAVDYAVAA